MIIGITGKAGSGKSTAAKVLVEQHGFVEVGLADPLKRICQEVFDFSDEQLWGPSEMRNAPDSRYRRSVDEKGCTCGQTFRTAEDFRDHLSCPALGPLFLTPRHALQQLGTQWGRACYENVWVDFALRVARKLLGQDPNGLGYTPQLGFTLTMKIGHKGVVIPDVRFPNEVDAIQKVGGRIWKCTRGKGLEGAVGTHASESFIDELPFNAFIPSDVTLEQLPEVIEAMLNG